MIKLTSPPRRIWVNGTLTADTFEEEAYVNPKYVMSIVWNDPIKKDFSKVIVQDAMTRTFSDIREPGVIAKLVDKELQKQLV